MRIQQSKKQFLIFFMLGFFIGILYANTIAKEYVTATGIFNEYFLNQYVQTEMIPEDYIWYILQVRLVPLFILCILGCSRLRRISAVGYLAWTGFSSGMIAVAAVMKLGIKGIIFCGIGLMPHFVFYILAYVILLWYLYSYPKVNWSMPKTICVGLSMIIGMMLEVYANPMLMKWFIGTL